MNDLVILNDASLRRYNTLGLNACAAVLYLPFSKEALIHAIRLTQGKKRILIGNGSNLLLAKEYYDDSYAFIVTSHADNLVIEGDEIIAEAGVSLNRLAWFCVEQSVDGYAFAEDIPGTVGGALIMNAGQFEYTIGMYVNWIEVFHTENETIERITPDAYFFGYRRSQLEERADIVLACGLKTPRGDSTHTLEKILEYKRERYRKQPREFPNAGSVFKRPTKDNQTYYVWKLFEETGLRGFRIGDAEVSTKHPGFFVNRGHATPKDMLALINECKKRVQERFAIDLHLEWKVID